ncbi:MAG: STAS-like domain-containing protein [Myxococcota bacterium]
MVRAGDKIVKMLAGRKGMSSGDVARELGMTRQAAHRHLRALLDAGTIVREGAGPATRYRLRRREHRLAYERSGLEEDRVWEDLRRRVPEIGALEGEAKAVFGYAVTELVNNAIDHSGSRDVEVVTLAEEGALEVRIIDHGVGIFHHLRNELGLESDLAALQELSKGKTTTQPERHTGEGIFFTSKVADRFEVQSGRLRWIVDNRREDMGVGGVSPAIDGTRVSFTADPERPRRLHGVFELYTDDLSFTRTRTVVKLFSIKVEFVSRSEARRLLHGLEKFTEVVLDFTGVEIVGQGFADEVFRVWQKAHPSVRLIPVNMSEPVAFMVERAKRV